MRPQTSWRNWRQPTALLKLPIQFCKAYTIRKCGTYYFLACATKRSSTGQVGWVILITQPFFWYYLLCLFTQGKGISLGLPHWEPNAKNACSFFVLKARILLGCQKFDKLFHHIEIACSSLEMRGWQNLFMCPIATATHLFQRSHDGLCLVHWKMTLFHSLNLYSLCHFSEFLSCAQN